MAPRRGGDLPYARSTPRTACCLSIRRTMHCVRQRRSSA
jgi:hypothetical protein